MPVGDPTGYPLPPQNPPPQPCAVPQEIVELPGDEDDEEDEIARYRKRHGFPE
jgi:hypothetical protein